MEKRSADTLAAEFLDFERIKGRIFYRLVNYKVNQERLKEVPFVPYCDLAVVFYILVEKTAGVCMSITIRNEQVRMWGIDGETLYRLAKRNTPELFPAEVVSIIDLLAMAMGEAGEGSRHEVAENKGRNNETKFPYPYILTNQGWLHGAAVMMYDGVLKRLAEELGKDLIILPSSIHEVLALPYEDGIKASELAEIVRYVNHTEVPPEAVLSENVYYYERETDTVRIFWDSMLRGRKQPFPINKKEEIIHV